MLQLHNTFAKFPTICNVGAFLYAGPVIAEADSGSGTSVGFIGEAQLKEGVQTVKGGASVQWDSQGNTHVSGPMIFAGPPVGPGAFVELPRPGSGEGTSIGGYYGVSKLTGAGAYGTVTSMGGCWQQQKSGS